MYAQTPEDAPNNSKLESILAQAQELASQQPATKTTPHGGNILHSIAKSTQHNEPELGSQWKTFSKYGADPFSRDNDGDSAIVAAMEHQVNNENLLRAVLQTQAPDQETIRKVENEAKSKPRHCQILATLWAEEARQRMTTYSNVFQRVLTALVRKNPNSEQTTENTLARSEKLR